MSCGFRDEDISPGRRAYTPTEHWRCLVFRLVMYALAKAGCSLKNMTWANKTFAEFPLEGLPIWAFTEDEAIRVSFGQKYRLLSNLRVLHLAKTWDIPLYFDDYEGFTGAASFKYTCPDNALANFVEMCPQLEVLYLAMGGAYVGHTRRNLTGYVLRTEPISLITLNTKAVNESYANCYERS